MLDRAYRSIPLIPVYCGLFILVVAMSPNFSFYNAVIAALLGLVACYSTTIFVDDYAGR
jgi:hypothetical protein